MIKKMCLFLFSVLPVITCASSPGKEKGNGIPDNKMETAAASYMRYIVNPVDNTGSPVRLENDETVIIFKPDMVFELTDKKTGKKTEGRSVFYTSISNERNKTRMDSAKVYLFESDINRVSLEQFLGNAGNLDERADIILAPLSCDETSVRYLRLKPARFRNKEITFTIR